MTLKVSLSVRQKGVEETIKGDIGREVTLKDLVKFTKEALIRTAFEAFRQERERGFDPDPRVRVDNSFRKPIFSVKPFGKIEFFARVNVGPVLLQSYQELLLRSPIDTGFYKRHHVVFYNRVQVADSLQSMERFVEKTTFKDRDKIVFINVTPYSARLESRGIRRGKGRSKGKNVVRRRRGRKKQSNGTIKVTNRANGAYFLAFRAIRSKFPAIAKSMKFAYLPNGADGITIKPFSGAKQLFRSSYKKSGKPYFYPSITITLTKEGIL